MINLDEKLKNVKSVAITGHIRPDGDCVGSTLGFYNYIFDNYNNIDAHVFLEKPGNEFSYMRNFDRVEYSLPDDAAYDLLVVFDCGASDRFAPFIKLLDVCTLVICIDHHMANEGFAHENYVIPDLSSTCELLFNCLCEEKISKETAECLYTGLITDTGIFKYQCVTSTTMNVAGKLMDKGINHTKIIDEGFFTKTYKQNLIMGQAVLDSKLILNDKCIYSIVTKQTMDMYGLTGKDMGGVIDQLRNTEGVEVAVFIYELSNNEYKVSMRAKDYVDVSLIGRVFGGGGHVKAAGCNICGTPKEVIDKISIELAKQLM